MKLRLETPINAPADTVWKTLGTDFVDIDTWAGFVKTSRAMTASEVPASIEVPANAPVPGRETMTKVKVQEVITAYSDEERSLTFQGIGLPKVIRLVQDKQSVIPTSDTSCTAVFDVTMEFMPPFGFMGSFMKKRMSKQFSEILDDLKSHSESMHAESMS